MNTVFKNSFLRDIKKIKDKKTKVLIKKVIISVETAKTLKEIPHLERFTSTKAYYKIKTPPYRFGVAVEEGTVYFVKFGIRENFYRDFPPK